MAELQFKSDVEAVEAFRQKYAQLTTEVGKVIIGQEDVLKEVLIAIFSGGHVLLVGVPGLAKTLLVTSISKALGIKHNRIQFTPDLMPSDIIGSEILNESRQFQFVKGPIFANVILADEINRTPPKTQSALLEAMQEKSVTAAGQTFKLDHPFFVLATQNPIEQEGTYPLPEAQLDRFMFNIWVDYPSFDEEMEVVRSTTNDESKEIESILSADEIMYYQHLVKRVPVTDNVLKYAVTLTAKTRPQGEYATDIVKQYVSWGAGPRASQYLILGAKTHALIQGKFAPDIEDVQAVALAILRHRIVPNYKAEAEGYNVTRIIKSLL
jgi:MoxR-like ATPase